MKLNFWAFWGALFCVFQAEAGKDKRASYTPLEYVEYMGMHAEPIKVLQSCLRVSSISWGEAAMILHQASPDTSLAIFPCVEDGKYDKTGWEKYVPLGEKPSTVVFQRINPVEELEDPEMLKKMAELIQDPTWGEIVQMERHPMEKITLHYSLPVKRSLEELGARSVSVEVNALKKGDVISSQMLEKEGALVCLPELGYGNNPCNQGKYDEQPSLPHIKRHIWLRLCAVSSEYMVYSLLRGKNDACPIKSAEYQIYPLLSFECFTHCEDAAVKVGHIDLALCEHAFGPPPVGSTCLRSGHLLEEMFEIDGVWFDKNTIGHAEYLRAIPGWEKNKRCGLEYIGYISRARSAIVSSSQKIHPGRSFNH